MSMPQAKKPATTPSLPGAQSTRTDGGIADKQVQRAITGMPNYGDGQEIADLQSAAPLAATPEAKGMTPSQIENAASSGAQQPQATAQPQEINLFKNMTGTPEPSNQTFSPVNTMQAPDPVETLARALYAANPTENLRRVVAQFDKALG